MKSNNTCPKCAGKKLAVVKQMRRDHREYEEQRPLHTIPVHVATIPLPDGTIGMDRGLQAVWSLGHFESWVCMTCGFTELYAYDIEGLATMAHHYPDWVRIIDAAPERGPFR